MFILTFYVDVEVKCEQTYCECGVVPFNLLYSVCDQQLEMEVVIYSTTPVHTANFVGRVLYILLLWSEKKVDYGG